MELKKTGADLFVDALDQYGVEYVFGNPGTTELAIMDALAGSDIDYILGLHEDIAVGMAGGYASTRRYHFHDDASINPVGVVNLHITPGLAHGLGNLYGAAVAGAPLVVTAGNHSTDFRHEEPILSGDLIEMTQQFTKWSDEVLDVDALPTMLRRAFQVALTPPTGPVFLSLPQDVMLAETRKTPERLGSIPSNGPGNPQDIAAAAEILVSADYPVLIVGDHISHSGADAVDSAVAFAEATGSRVHAEILSCEVNFPTDHDQWASYVPANEDTARSCMDTDTLILAGISTHTTLTRHEKDLVSPETTCIHAGHDPWELGKNVPADVAVRGDLGRIFSDLAEFVSQSIDENTLQNRLSIANSEARGIREKVTGFYEGGINDEDDRSSKFELVDTICRVAPEAYIVDEGVTSKYALLNRRDLHARGFLSNKGGGLGYGLPASIGAAIAEQSQESPREVIGFVGDGAFLYYPHSIYSATRYDLDMTIIVADNRNYRILKNNTAKILGGSVEDYDFVGMDFDPHVDIPKSAMSHGATSHHVERPDELQDILETSIDRPGVDVVDVLIHD